MTQEHMVLKTSKDSITLGTIEIRSLKSLTEVVSYSRNKEKVILTTDNIDKAKHLVDYVWGKLIEREGLSKSEKLRRRNQIDISHLC